MKTTSAKPTVSDRAKWADALAKAQRYGDSLTDGEDAALTKAALADSDNPPFAEDARLVSVEEVRRRPGRPRVPSPKQQITIRLDADVIERLRATGSGWQVRVNEVLKNWLAAAK